MADKNIVHAQYRVFPQIERNISPKTFLGNDSANFFGNVETKEFSWEQQNKYIF